MMLTSLIPTLLAAADPAQTAAPLTADAVLTEGPVALALGLVVRVGVASLVLGIVLCLYRVLRGPHLADRVLAADTLALQVVGLVLLLSIQTRTTAFFDLALVVAIIGFASTLAFAQYIGARGGRRAGS